MVSGKCKWLRIVNKNFAFSSTPQGFYFTTNKIISAYIALWIFPLFSNKTYKTVQRIKKKVNDVVHHMKW